MAHVTLTDGREVDVPDDNTVLLDYYRGEGATVVGVAETVAFPVVFEHGERVDPPEPPVVAEEGEYDPGEYVVADVNEHLAGLDEQARERVFELERAGQARVGILDGPYAVFDPSTHTVEEVLAYLASLDDQAEYDRVVAAERAGEARKGILGD